MMQAAKWLSEGADALVVQPVLCRVGRHANSECSGQVRSDRMQAVVESLLDNRFGDSGGCGRLWARQMSVVDHHDDSALRTWQLGQRVRGRYRQSAPVTDYLSWVRRPAGDHGLGCGTSTWQLSIFGFMPR